MELRTILSGLENLKIKGSLDIDVLNIKNDSRSVNKGDMFLATL